MTGLPPGPRAPAAAQAALWGLRYPQFTAAAHARHGPTFTVRLGTMGPIVVTADRDAIRRLLSGDPLKRPADNGIVRPMMGERSLLLLAPEPHLARRRLLLPAFHGERVAGHRALMQTLVDEELARWRPGETLAVLPMAQRVTLQVILRAVLGLEDAAPRNRLRDHVDDLAGYPLTPIARRAGLHRSGRTDAAPGTSAGLAAMAGALLTPAVLTFFPAFKARSRWNLSTLPFFRILDAALALVDEQIAATRTDPRLRERTDILALMVLARDEDGRGLEDVDLRDELWALILAGHETTATAIAWSVEVLTRDEALRTRATRAADEGDAAYIAAFVKELLRLRPPLPVTSNRILDEPFAVGHHTLPPGTPLAIDAYAVHRDPEVWPEPEAFRPERFLNGTPAPYSWLPFGGGAHRCIGATMASMELEVTLAAILRAAEIAPADGRPATPVRRMMTLVPSGGGRLSVRRRRDHPRP